MVLVRARFNRWVQTQGGENWRSINYNLVIFLSFYFKCLIDKQLLSQEEKRANWNSALEKGIDCY